MGRRLRAFEVVPSKTLLVLVDAEALDRGYCPGWVEGDVCIVEGPAPAMGLMITNLRLSLTSSWPSPSRFALLEDETNG